MSKNSIFWNSNICIITLLCCVKVFSNFFVSRLSMLLIRILWFFLNSINCLLSGFYFHFTWYFSLFCTIYCTSNFKMSMISIHFYLRKWLLFNKFCNSLVTDCCYRNIWCSKRKNIIHINILAFSIPHRVLNSINLQILWKLYNFNIYQWLWIMEMSHFDCSLY